MSIKNIAIRYGISTFGLILVALGVALSIKSNLGIAPPSCPPTVLNLRWGGISVGTFTWISHLFFILVQLLILRKDFKASYLMQIPAAFVFGYLCDGAIWLMDAGNFSASYPVQILLSLAAVLITAIGIKIEIMGGGWVLAGDMTAEVISMVARKPFGTVKVFFDLTLVALTCLFAYICFANPFGDGTVFIVREGTIILAVLTGICMRFTDPVMDRLIGPLVPEK